MKDTTPRATAARFGSELTGVQPADHAVDDVHRSVADPSPTQQTAAAIAAGQTVPATETRRERRRQEILDRLISAARTMLFGRNLKDLRILDITEAADVGKGTFFNYFPSKELVLPPIVVASSSRQIEAALARTVAGQEDAWQALVSSLREYLCPEVGDWLTYEGNILLAMVGNPEVRRQISERLEKNIPVFEALMALGQEQGSIRQDVTPGELTRVLRAFISGFTITFWINDVTPTRELVDIALGELQRTLAPSIVSQAVTKRSRKAPAKAKPSRRPTSRGRR